MFGERNCKNHL